MKKLAFTFLAILASHISWSQCKPTKILSKIYSWDVSYNSEGKISKVVDNSENVYDIIYNENGKLSRMNYSEENEMLEWMIFKDEIVEFWDEDGLYEKYVYEYNSEGLPTKVERQKPSGEVRYIRTFKWQGGNIVELSAQKPGEDPEVSKFQYGSDSNPLKVLRPLLEFGIDFGYSEILSNNSIIVYSLSGKKDYNTPVKLNDDGCVSKITEGRDKKGYKEFLY